MITRNYCATGQRWRRMGGLPKQWVNKKIETCSMYFLFHMLTPGSIACCSVIYCFTDDEDDGAWNCCHPQGLLVPSSNVNQPKANSTQEGVKNIVAQTGETQKRKPKNGQIYWWANSCPSITCHTESRKVCVSTQVQSELVDCPYCNCTGFSYHLFLGLQVELALLWWTHENIYTKTHLHLVCQSSS